MALLFTFILRRDYSWGEKALKYLYPPKSEAVLHHNVGLWLDGKCRSNFVIANVAGIKEPWAVRGQMPSSRRRRRTARMRCTDEEPTLQTLWQYALRFRIPPVKYTFRLYLN